jgi:hypothetical protein
VSVATVRLLFVLEAKKVSRLETEVVASTPLIVEVITPELAVIALELIVVVVEIDPPTFEVSVFPVEESVFGTEIESTARFEMVALVIEAFCEKRFVLVAFVRVALPAFRFWVFVVVATMLARLAVPVAVMLVPVALSKKRLVNQPVIAAIVFVTMLSAVVVPISSMSVRPSTVVVANTPFTVLVIWLVVEAKLAVFELIIEEVDVTPFTVEVSVFTALVSEF